MNIYNKQSDFKLNYKNESKITLNIDKRLSLQYLNMRTRWVSHFNDLHMRILALVHAPHDPLAVTQLRLSTADKQESGGTARAEILSRYLGTTLLRK